MSGRGGRGFWARWTVRTPEDPDEAVPVVFRGMSPTYFSTLGIELLAGDGWTAADQGTDPAPVVLSAELARQLFGRTEGVVGRIVEPRPEIYVPAWMVPFASPRLSVAAKLAPGAGSPTVDTARCS